MCRPSTITLCCMTCFTPRKFRASRPGKFCSSMCSTNPRPITAAERERVIALHAEGKPLGEIASDVGRPLGTIGGLVAQLAAAGAVAYRQIGHDRPVVTW